MVNGQTHKMYKGKQRKQEKLKIVSVIQLYVEVIKYSFKIHNVLLSEKALVRFYNKLKTYYRTINTRIKRIGVIKTEVEMIPRKSVIKKISKMEISQIEFMRAKGTTHKYAHIYCSGGGQYSEIPVFLNPQLQ